MRVQCPNCGEPYECEPFQRYRGNILVNTGRNVIFRSSNDGQYKQAEYAICPTCDVISEDGMTVEDF